MDCIKRMTFGGWKTKVIDTTFAIDEGDKALESALDRVGAESLAAVDEGYHLIVYSDRTTGPSRAPISPMLVVGRGHTVLVHAKKRTKIGTPTSPQLLPYCP